MYTTVLHKCQIMFFLQCSVSVFLFVVISLNETQTLLHTYIIQFKNELRHTISIIPRSFLKMKHLLKSPMLWQSRKLNQYLYNNVEGLTILSHLVILKINKIILVFRPKIQVRNISWAEISDVFLASLRSLIYLLAWQVKYYKINIKIYLLAIITVRAKF